VTAVTCAPAAADHNEDITVVRIPNCGWCVSRSCQADTVLCQGVRIRRERPGAAMRAAWPARPEGRGGRCIVAGPPAVTAPPHARRVSAPSPHRRQPANVPLSSWGRPATSRRGTARRAPGRYRLGPGRVADRLPQAGTCDSPFRDFRLSTTRWIQGTLCMYVRPSRRQEARLGRTGARATDGASGCTDRWDVGPHWVWARSHRPGTSGYRPVFPHPVRRLRDWPRPGLVADREPHRVQVFDAAGTFRMGTNRVEAFGGKPSVVPTATFTPAVTRTPTEACDPDRRPLARRRPRAS
jgi:hypothetical protein